MANIRILITEDERIIALDIKQVLINHGFDVVGIVSTGKGAIKKVKEEKPDLVLMDIILNGPITGIETAEIISRETGTPIIFITALDLIKDSHYDSITKKYTCLKKPFNELELTSAILENLKLKKAANAAVNS